MDVQTAHCYSRYFQFLLGDTHTCTHTHMYMHMHTQALHSAVMHACILAHIHVYTMLHTYRYISVCLCMCLHVNIFLFMTPIWYRKMHLSILLSLCLKLTFKDEKWSIYLFIQFIE